MLIKRLVYASILTVLAGILAVTPALAIPPMPSSFYGIVSINGASVAQGTRIDAYIHGVSYAHTFSIVYQGNSVFALDIPGDDPATPDIIEGGKEGDLIQFKIGIHIFDQTGLWHSATNVSQNLNTELYFSYLPILRN